IPVNLQLETQRVLLRPLNTEDFGALYTQSSQDETMWEYFSSNLNDPHQLQNWLADSIKDKEAGTRMPFAIIDKVTGKLAGSSSLLNISWKDKRLEIGASWLGPDYRSTGLNRQ